MMRTYSETRSCRRQLLLAYFGEELGEPCGNCDTCSDGSAFEEPSAPSDDASGNASGDASAEFPPSSQVRHREWGAGTVMSVDDDRITVFFETEGYKVLSLDAVDERDLLEAVAGA